MKERFGRIGMVIGAVLSALYLSSYAFFRVNSQIVHDSATAGGRYTYHRVGGGDAPLIGASINASIASFYTPLCAMEQAAWYRLQPIGSECPKPRN